MAIKTEVPKPAHTGIALIKLQFLQKAVMDQYSVENIILLLFKS